MAAENREFPQPQPGVTEFLEKMSSIEGVHAIVSEQQNWERLQGKNVSQREALSLACIDAGKFIMERIMPPLALNQRLTPLSFFDTTQLRSRKASEKERQLFFDGYGLFLVGVLTFAMEQSVAENAVTFHRSTLLTKHDTLHAFFSKLEPTLLITPPERAHTNAEDFVLSREAWHWLVKETTTDQNKLLSQNMQETKEMPWPLHLLLPPYGSSLWKSMDTAYIAFRSGRNCLPDNVHPLEEDFPATIETLREVKDYADIYSQLRRAFPEDSDLDPDKI